MKISATRIIKFDTGHRVVNHESKCKTLHGHEYHAHIYATADQLDGIGRVIDFSVIKELIGQWIDENWDHTMIIWEKDPNLKHLLLCEGHKNIWVSGFNPTAENMAQYLLDVICPTLLKNTGVVVDKIRLYETSNCYVEVSL
jgi:6-pyruvoyltetrahydropterin/6-carboxytetrahydropterin synthase